MITFKNFLSTNLFTLLNEKICSIDVDTLEDIFDANYENKSTKILECIPLRIHQKSLISYKSLLIDKDILDKFRLEILNKLKSYKINNIKFQVCIWDQESYLQMHYDKIYKYGGTLYLNKNWEKSWGGLFEYQTKIGEITTICPQQNLFIFNNCNEEHQVTPIASKAPEKRKSIQVWMLD